MACLYWETVACQFIQAAQNCVHVIRCGFIRIPGEISMPLPPGITSVAVPILGVIETPFVFNDIYMNRFLQVFNVMSFREMRRNFTSMAGVRRKYRGTAWDVYLAVLSTWPSTTSAIWKPTVMTSLRDFYIRCRHITTPECLVTMFSRARNLVCNCCPSDEY